MSEQIRIDLAVEDPNSGRTLNGINKAVRDLGKSAAQVAKETAAGAGLTKGSFAELRAELASNRKALEHLEVGSEAFAEQAEVVSALEEKFRDAKAEIIALTKAGGGVSEMAAEVQIVENSVDGLKMRLKEANAIANAAEFGSDEFKKARAEADKLEGELKDVQQAHKRTEDATDAHENSLKALERQIREATDELERMDRKSDAFREQQKKVDRLKSSMAGYTSGVGKSKMSLQSWGIAAGVAVGAGVAYVSTLNSISEAASRAAGEVADSDLALDTMARRLQVQAGLTDEGRQKEIREVLDVALERGATAEDAVPVAIQLTSSGFEKDRDILNEVLKTQQVTNFEGSSQELVVGLGEFLESYGLDKDLDNVKKITTASQGLFKATDFQLTDLKDLAKQGTVLKKANIPEETSLAAFGTLRETLPSGEASTGLRNFVSILQTAGAEKSKVKALEGLGIKPEEVDLVGESLDDVLRRLKVGIASVSEEQANLSAGKLFGRENVASATLLIENQDRVTELEGLLQDRQTFERDAITVSEGRQATENRRQVRGQIRVVSGAGAGAAEIVDREKDQKEKFQIRRDEVLAGDDPEFVKALKIAAVDKAEFLAPAARLSNEALSALIGADVNAGELDPVLGKLPLLGGFFGRGGDERREVQHVLPQRPQAADTPERNETPRLPDEQRQHNAKMLAAAERQAELLEKALKPASPIVNVRVPAARQAPAPRPPLARAMP